MGKISEMTEGEFNNFVDVLGGNSQELMQALGSVQKKEVE